MLLSMLLAVPMPRPSDAFHHAPPLCRRSLVDKLPSTTRRNNGAIARGSGSLYSATLDVDAESVNELSLPQSTATSDSYSATQITVLEGLDPVRKRCVVHDFSGDATSPH